VADTPAAPIVPVQFNENAIAEDLTHHPPVARKALDLFRREIDRDDGLPFSRLKRCEDEGRDGTRLGGCVKTYIPWPTGRRSRSASSCPPHETACVASLCLRYPPPCGGQA
jgi:hypothetical protein